MSSEDDDGIAKLAAETKHGSIIAAAGCGKTEQIAKATKLSTRRRLILTHTHAGVDVLRNRMDLLHVPSAKYSVDTIAGWCLRYAAAYPKHSGLNIQAPRSNEEWNSIYSGAAAVIQAGSVDVVLPASYEGVFVDEYQDCSPLQHGVVTALSEHLPVCVFGDPLQAIFDFKGQEPVDFTNDVFPIFPEIGKLVKPWRWHKHGNKDLADWLEIVRHDIEQKGEIDLSAIPACVTVDTLPDDNKTQRSAVVSAAKSALAEGEKLIVIGDSASLGSRVGLARQLASVGFSNIEPVGCPTMYTFAKNLDKAVNGERLTVVSDFLAGCMTGMGAAEFHKAVNACKDGKHLGRARYSDLIDLGVAIQNGSVDDRTLLDLMFGFSQLDETHIYRREMLYTICSALKLKLQRPGTKLDEAIAEVQCKIRHAGRKVGYRSVGSTLLIKGLEFDRSVIVGQRDMSKKDWYVALTRATKGMTILAPSKKINFTAPKPMNGHVTKAKLPAAPKAQFELF